VLPGKEFQIEMPEKNELVKKQLWVVSWCIKLKTGK